MNMTQISEHIFRCEFEITIPLHLPVHIWLVRDGDQVYIIDTGTETMVDAQIEAALSLGNPAAIFLTHGHGDHIRGAAGWIEKYGIPVYAHKDELIYINGQAPYPNKNVLEQTGVAHLVQPLTESVMEHIPLQYHLTPGHSPGHVVYHHTLDNVLLAGDLFITSHERLHPPIRKFSVNMNQNIDSGAVVDRIQPTLISSSHGQDLLYTPGLYSSYKFIYEG